MSGVKAEALKEISREIAVCEDVECGGECSDELSKDEAVFNKLKLDWETPLFQSSKIPRLLFVVPTSQTDWQHDACLEFPQSVQYHIHQWCQAHKDQYAEEGQLLTCTVSSLPKNILDIEVMRHVKNNVLVLPHFIWIHDLRSEQVDATLNELVPQLVQSGFKKDEFIAKYPDLLSESKEDSYVMICSHMTRDKRCGITAPILKKVFDNKLMEVGLYRDYSDLRQDGVQVCFVNHVGGHKFAANVQIFLRRSGTIVWLGRVTPRDVAPIVNYLLVQETPSLPFPEKVRCVHKYQW